MRNYPVGVCIKKNGDRLWLWESVRRAWARHSRSVWSARATAAADATVCVAAQLGPVDCVSNCSQSLAPRLTRATFARLLQSLNLQMHALSQPLFLRSPPNSYYRFGPRVQSRPPPARAALYRSESRRHVCHLEVTELSNNQSSDSQSRLVIKYLRTIYV